mmetsp:Transcript_21091/g.49333  ORF Transcript_21091/g.49333 Transcript_21091/m.49333 type:complete len:276 (-) Transcript_21091:1177-2004(-)
MVVHSQRSEHSRSLVGKLLGLLCRERWWCWRVPCVPMLGVKLRAKYIQVIDGEGRQVRRPLSRIGEIIQDALCHCYGVLEACRIDNLALLMQQQQSSRLSSQEVVNKREQLPGGVQVVGSRHERVHVDAIKPAEGAHIAEEANLGSQLDGRSLIMIDDLTRMQVAVVQVVMVNDPLEVKDVTVTVWAGQEAVLLKTTSELGAAVDDVEAVALFPPATTRNLVDSFPPFCLYRTRCSTRELQSCLVLDSARRAPLDHSQVCARRRQFWWVWPCSLW